MNAFFTGVVQWSQIISKCHYLTNNNSFVWNIKGLRPPVTIIYVETINLHLWLFHSFLVTVGNVNGFKDIGIKKKGFVKNAHFPCLIVIRDRWQSSLNLPFIKLFNKQKLEKNSVDRTVGL